MRRTMKTKLKKKLNMPIVSKEKIEIRQEWRIQEEIQEESNEEALPEDMVIIEKKRKK